MTPQPGEALSSIVARLARRENGCEKSHRRGDWHLHDEAVQRLVEQLLPFTRKLAAPVAGEGLLARWPEADLFAALDAEGWFRGISTAEATRATKKLYNRLAPVVGEGLDELTRDVAAATNVAKWVLPLVLAVRAWRDTPRTRDMRVGQRLELAILDAISDLDEYGGDT